MYVVRYNAKIKRGRMPDAIAFSRKRKLKDSSLKIRLLANVFGDNDILAMEVTFDDIEAVARHVAWVEGDAQAEITAQGWYDISAGNVVELWKVVE